MSRRISRVNTAAGEGVPVSAVARRHPHHWDEEEPLSDAILSSREEFHLARSHELTFLALVARDPFSLHAFWDISARDLRRLAKRAGKGEKSSLVLRVYELTAGESGAASVRHTFDTEVESVGNRNYNLWRDGGTYFGEVGLRSQNGSFLPLARSPTVSTPRSGKSDRTEIIWMDPNGPGRAKAFAVVASPALAHVDGSNRHPTGAALLSEEAIRAYYSRLYSPGNPELLFSHESRNVAPGTFAEWNSPPLSISGPDTQEHVGTSAQWGGASERLSGDLRFRLQTELIVHGRTDPGSRVWWGGREVPVNEDGSFRLELPLPEGTVPLELTAVSRDEKQSRTISTQVTRAPTDYLAHRGGSGNG